MGNLFNASALASVVSFVIVAVPLLSLWVVPALVRWVWNLTLPQLFSLPPIGHWQAFRLMVLAGLLFGLPRLI